MFESNNDEVGFEENKESVSDFKVVVFPGENPVNLKGAFPLVKSPTPLFVVSEPGLVDEVDVDEVVDDEVKGFVLKP